MNKSKRKSGSKRRERTTSLIAEFKNGYAIDWQFKLPEAFKDALDIKLTRRIIRKKVAYVLTQGDYFTFKQGDVMYDSTLAYKLPWGQALRACRYAVQVMSDDGAIEFRLLSMKSSGVKTIGTYNCNQIELVRFLKSGEMRDAKGQYINLLELDSRLARRHKRINAAKKQKVK